MFRPDPYAPNGVHHDTQPFPVHFPSVNRVSYGDDYRPRSHSADTRRQSFHQRRIFSEEQAHDPPHSHSAQPFPPEQGYPAEAAGYDEGTLRRGAANVIYDEASATLRRSVNSVQFPSTYRERVDEQHKPQFNSAAHNFTQHLRERSPSSSSALLNLLSRYPSARQSVYSSTSTSSTVSTVPRIYRFDERPVDTHSYRPTDAVPGYPLVELSVPKQQPSQHTSPSPHHPQSPPLNGQAHPARGSSLSNSVYSNFSYSPTFSQSSDDTNRWQSQRFANGYATLRNPNTLKEFDNRSEHKFYTDLPNNNHTLGARNKRWDELLDVTQLDSLLASVLEDNMNRSTTEWSNSFAQVQNRFKNMPPESSSSGVLHGFTSSGAPTLPRRTILIPRSASNNDMQRSDPSVLGSAVERRAAEAPEMRKSGAIDSFWSHTVNSRPSSPTVQRIAGNLTAAERLQMLHEDSVTTTTSTINKPGTGAQLAARREHYLHEASSASTYTPPHREAAVRPGTPALRGPSPNFSDLDNAVQELQFGVRPTGYSNSARRLGGCARFPTDEHALSPPRGGSGSISRHVNSPSPTDSNSETSSVYQTPTGLPHPKPKHNIKEQLSNAGVPSYTFSRTGPRVSPSFPVPTTGSVASRITEFEKRPGTPTLQIASAPRLEKSPVSNGPMSPKSTVYKSKPVIHVETGSRSPRSLNSATTVFDFPPTKKREEEGVPLWEGEGGEVRDLRYPYVHICAKVLTNNRVDVTGCVSRTR
ncbi:hypothetical protein ANCCEY_06532 [Ancylostoma ceylanicum]|uniref:Uncharacterized protein n=1 Tax=Ancylostoma ceylanicum TaxID=53326 RepID=A0A0D6LT60_9BILA|nr:hypothetical protein ANCCEY_06532 [Ancylostoma ceylanicum]